MRGAGGGRRRGGGGRSGGCDRITDIAVLPPANVLTTLNVSTGATVSSLRYGPVLSRPYADEQGNLILAGLTYGTPEGSALRLFNLSSQGALRWSVFPFAPLSIAELTLPGPFLTAGTRRPGPSAGSDISRSCPNRR